MLLTVKGRWKSGVVGMFLIDTHELRGIEPRMLFDYLRRKGQHVASKIDGKWRVFSFAETDKFATLLEEEWLEKFPIVAEEAQL